MDSLLSSNFFIFNSEFSYLLILFSMDSVVSDDLQQDGFMGPVEN